MPEPSVIQQQRQAVHRLLQAIAERDRRETELLTWLGTRKAEIDKEILVRREQIDAQHREQHEAAEQRLAHVREAIPQRLATSLEEIATRRVIATKQAKHQAREQNAGFEEQANRARWEATALLEAARSDIDSELDDRRKHFSESEQALTSIREDAEIHLARCRMSSAAAGAIRGAEHASRPTVPEPLQALDASLSALDQQLSEIESLPLPKLFRNANFLAIYLGLALAIGVPAVLWIDPIRGAALGAIAALVLGTVITLLLYRMGTSQIRRRYPMFREELTTADTLLHEAETWVEQRAEQRLDDSRAQHMLEVRKAERVLAAGLEGVESKLDEQLGAIEEQARAQAEQTRKAHHEELDHNVQAETSLIQELAQQRADALIELDARELCSRDEFRERSDRTWRDLSTFWKGALEHWSAETTRIIETCRRAFTDWSEPGFDSAGWCPPASGAPAMRFGQFEVAPAALAAGTPRDPRLRELQPGPVRLPALSPIPEGSGPFLVRAYGDGRPPALDILRAMMLRMLTSVPPGKVRFTIFDPIGLGQNFAGFMHLADYDEALVGSRIWTEEGHIESKLSDLTEHMEKVIQKYLRNEFETIQQYNDHAGEVAEPYRVLVIANFPANFNESSGRRLLSICQSGPRCGVYPLVMVDERETLPPGVTMADLERHATVLVWRDGRLSWKDPDFGGYPLELDSPPSEAVLTDLLRTVGQQAKDASRVEVPFQIVVPDEQEFWQGDSRKGVEIPLGRVGANKLQFLRLGHGTSQHVLIAGRTGSGKSTLLHAMIVSAGLRYNPDQLELYLIDFKKGVEFKTYASHKMPHARVVAIESEREFGLSVLQKLDLEMKQRGELFRERGVQDLAGFRESAAGDGQPALPRLLLVVDEFQEFFVDDDRVAQDAALLLDRLVRQGRAFGIHVMLGSQSLGGAFTLARSTMGQMAVRIALQCSESDAHLILNEENTAARLLSRPGEAIYNDANGIIEGNNFFQVVWLSDSLRDEYLARITELDRRRDGHASRSQIVFEGQTSAELAENPVLDRLLAALPATEEPRAPVAWLGDAVAIKDPTAATFRRQSGANLLVVGQNPEAALGMFLGAIAGLAAQHPSSIEVHGAGELSRFTFLDGTPDDAHFAGLAATLLGGLPSCEVVDWRDAARPLTALAAELKLRQDEARYEAPSLYVFIDNLSRFRDLRKSEDDFGFSRRDEASVSPSQQFTDILRDGPAYGIHVICWCDSWNNLQRMLDRQVLREFEQRVLFQVSPTDSSNLIDSPVAGKLGPHRALYASEEEGILEKFRPYGLPARAWWDQLRARLGDDRNVPATTDS